MKEKPIWEDWRKKPDKTPLTAQESLAWPPIPQRSGDPLSRRWRFRWIAFWAAGVSLAFAAFFILDFAEVDQWTNGQGFGLLAGGMVVAGIIAIALGAYGWAYSRRGGMIDKASRTACWLGIVGFVAPGILGVGLQGYSLTFQGNHEGPGVCSDRDLRAGIVSVSPPSGPSPGVVVHVSSLASYRIEVQALRIFPSPGHWMDLRTNGTSIEPGASGSIRFVPFGPDYDTRDVGTFSTSAAWSDYALSYRRDLASGGQAGMRCHIVGDGLPEAFLA